MSLLQIVVDKPTLQPQIIFEFWGIPISNTILMTWLVIFLFIIFLVLLRKKMALIPKGLQNVAEAIYEGFAGLIGQITGDKKYAEKLFPLIATLFIFLIIANLIGLVPILTSFTYDGVPILRTPSNDFNLTFSLALFLIILIQLKSIRDWGFWGHLGKYFKFKEIYLGFRQGFSSGILAIVDFFIGLLDVISEFAKIISLSLRLFGNMYAGEVLAILILGAFAYGLPAVWLAMNILVGVVQAIVFGSLAAAYYMMAIKQEEVLNNN